MSAPLLPQKQVDITISHYLLKREKEHRGVRAARGEGASSKVKKRRK
jgi:hypothetical protein